MPRTYAQLEVRRMRGDLVVIGQARTARGQRYIKGQEAIGVKRIDDKEFKSKLAAAIAKLTAATG